MPSGVLSSRRQGNAPAYSRVTFLPKSSRERGGQNEAEGERCHKLAAGKQIHHHQDKVHGYLVLSVVSIGNVPYSFVC